jgi:hypothetical protein
MNEILEKQANQKGLLICILKRRFISAINKHAMLSGSLIIMAWHVLRLQTEKTASSYGWQI